MNTRTKVILAFIIIFLMGFISGYFLNRAAPGQYESRTEQAMQQEDETDRRERFRRARVRLSENLGLTELQSDDFFTKLRAYHTEIRESVRERRDDEHEMLKQSYDQFRDEVSSILDAGQLEVLDSHFHPDSVRSDRQRGPHRGRN